MRGLVFRPSKKDYLWERSPFFGAASIAYDLAPLGRLEAVCKSSLQEHPLYQDHFYSCVVCAATFVNQYNSLFRSGNPAYLSWPFAYSQVAHYPTGTIPQDVLDFLRKTGQPENSSLPQEKVWAAEDFFVSNPNLAASETGVGADRYRIGEYFFWKKPTLQTLYPALKDDPLLIGIFVDPATWIDEGIIPPTNRGYQHMVVLLDIDKDWNMKVVSWDKKDALDIRTLHKDYPLLMAAVIRDLPDGTDTARLRRGWSIGDILGRWRVSRRTVIAAVS